MNPFLPDPVGYKSHSQRARVATESWVAGNLYCPACPSPRLDPTLTGHPVADFVCPKCGEEYQLKSKHGKLGARITDAAYSEALRAAERNAFLHQLIVMARTLDPTRLITTATNQTNATEPHKRIFDDPIIADLDVFGVNEYIGWYEGVPADLDITTWSTPYNKPMIVSEFGGDAKYGLHGAASQRWTEEYQEDIYKHQIAALRKIPFLRGTSPWILKDFRSPHRQLPGIQDGFNRKGLISERGERKKAFYVLQRFYRELATQTAATAQ